MSLDIDFCCETFEIRPSTNENDGCSKAWNLPIRCNEILALKPRYREIHQDDGWAVCLRQLTRLCMVRCADDGVTLILEDQGDEVADERVVVDDQEGGGGVQRRH